jgi:hypothetical protein
LSGDFNGLQGQADNADKTDKKTQKSEEHMITPRKYQEEAVSAIKEAMLQDIELPVNSVQEKRERFDVRGKSE